MPYMIIVGEKEAAAGTISVRDRATDQTAGYTVAEFIEKARREISRRCG